MKGEGPYSFHYPISLNLRGKRCVVIGGGQVALRKAEALLACGALVEVVSPEMNKGLLRLTQEGEVRLLQRPYRSGDLEGAFVAIAATNDRTTNLKVVAEAQKREGLDKCGG